MSQNGTSSSAPRELAPKQAKALEHLLAATSVTDAAKGAGIGRSTLHRWLREDPAFQAAYNGARRDLQREVEIRLLVAATHAAQTVCRAARAGNVQASLALLKGIGALAGEPYAIGPDCADEVEAEREEAEANRVFDWLKAQL